MLKLGWLGNKKDDEFIEISEINRRNSSSGTKTFLLFSRIF